MSPRVRCSVPMMSEDIHCLRSAVGSRAAAPDVPGSAGGTVGVGGGAEVGADIALLVQYYQQWTIESMAGELPNVGNSSTADENCKDIVFDEAYSNPTNNLYKEKIFYKD